MTAPEEPSDEEVRASERERAAAVAAMAARVDAATGGWQQRFTPLAAPRPGLVKADPPRQRSSRKRRLVPWVAAKIAALIVAGLSLVAAVLDIADRLCR